MTAGVAAIVVTGLALGTLIEWLEFSRFTTAVARRLSWEFWVLQDRYYMTFGEATFLAGLIGFGICVAIWLLVYATARFCFWLVELERRLGK